MHRGPRDIKDKVHNVRGDYVQVLFGNGTPGTFLYFQPFKCNVHGCVPGDVVQLEPLFGGLQKIRMKSPE